MNVTDYTYLMNKPDAITEKQAEALGNVLNEFPYFQSARALRLKGLYNQNSFKYNYALKVTAAHTTDRSVLFDFITSESFTAVQSEYYDQKLKDLLNITVFDSEIVLAEEKRKLAEVRIDPIEKSILDSIKEATGTTYEEPVKIIEKPTLDSFTEATTSTAEEPVRTEEIPATIIIEEPTLDTFTEVTTFTSEEPLNVAETVDPIIIEEPTIDSFAELNNSTEAPSKIEERSFESIIPTLDSFEEVTVTTTIEEPVLVEENPIETVTEQLILDSFQDVNSVTFEAPPTIEENPIELIIQQPTLDSFEEVAPTNEDAADIETNTTVEAIPIIKEPTPTFFDEIVEEEFPVVRVEPIEESIYNSLQEVSTVVFEEAPVVEEPEIIEEPKVIAVSETVKTAEENLEIGKPLDFSANEKHSFQEWLQLAKTEPIDRTKDTPAGPGEAIKIVESSVEKATEPETIEDEKKKKAEIIDKFIEANPKISPIRQTAIIPAVQLDSNNEENSYLMTETLARVYLEQKKYTKAIQAYEILILKYPEKISFFADRISDIKILQQNNNNN